MPKRDLRRLQLSPRYLAMLRALLSQQAPEADAWAYGSRVSGSAHEGSDLNIVLRNPVNPEAEIKGRVDVLEAVQESDLPMLVDVHDWAHLPAELHREFERSYEVVRNATPPEPAHDG
jgi:predicted nucleotidyltransferase